MLLSATFSDSAETEGFGVPRHDAATRSSHDVWICRQKKKKHYWENKLIVMSWSVDVVLVGTAPNCTDLLWCLQVCREKCTLSSIAFQRPQDRRGFRLHDIKSMPTKKKHGQTPRRSSASFFCKSIIIIIIIIIMNMDRIGRIHKWLSRECWISWYHKTYQAGFQALCHYRPSHYQLLCLDEMVLLQTFSLLLPASPTDLRISEIDQKVRTVEDSAFNAADDLRLCLRRRWDGFPHICCECGSRGLSVLCGIQWLLVPAYRAYNGLNSACWTVRNRRNHRNLRFFHHISRWLILPTLNKAEWS